MKPLLLHTPSDLKSWRQQQFGSVGFVPTMGALHKGHAELLKRAKKENNILVLSLFVNPTQFNNPEDYEKYPQTFTADLDLATKCGVDVIFAPTKENLYPDQYQYQVIETNFSHLMEGQHRPGHFNGVLTVVMKLLQIVQAHKAYFGEKDYQQLELIKGMVSAFFIDTEIIPVATVRQDDGLALSSRNLRLSESEKKQAAFIYKTLTTAENAEKAKAQLSEYGFVVDYVTDHRSRRYVAATLGEVRLIDNVEI